MMRAVLLIVLGLLAILPHMAKNRPNLKKFADEAAPYLGWFGVICVIFGLVELFRCLVNIAMFADAPKAWLFWLIIALILIALGNILGYGLIYKYALSKNPDAAQAGEKMRAKLLPLQTTLGIAAIVFGILGLISLIARAVMA